MPTASEGHRTGFPVVGLAALALLGLLFHQPAEAQDSLKKTTSLRFVPADADVYGVLLKPAEMRGAVVRSKAFGKLKELLASEAVAGAAQGADLTTMLEKLDDPAALLKMLLAGPQAPAPGDAAAGGVPKAVAEFLDDEEFGKLLREMAAEEIFFYGDDRVVDFIQIPQEVITTGALSRLFMAGMSFGGQAGGLEIEPAAMPKEADDSAAGPPDTVIELGNFDFGPADTAMTDLLGILETLNDNIDSLEIPDMVVGFKITSAAAAKAQIDRLEAKLRPSLGPATDGKKRLARETVGGTEYLTIRLDGSMIPFEKIPFEQLEEKKGQYDALVKKLGAMKLTICVGVRDGYVILSIGEDNAHLAAMGGEKLLADLPELAPLGKAADKNISGIWYASKTVTEKTKFSGDSVDRMTGLLGGVGGDNTGGPLGELITADLKRLGGELLGPQREPGPVLRFWYPTARGIEGYCYSYSESEPTEQPRVLSLLDHVGGNPIFFHVGSGERMLRTCDVATGMLSKVLTLAAPLGALYLQGEDAELLADFVKKIGPIVSQLEAANGSALSAIDGTQTAVVLDAPIKGRRWVASMPPSKEPLPMLVPAVVFGVKDAELLKKAGTQYLAAADELVAQLHELAPQQVPNTKLPAPKSQDFASGTVYYYMIPKDFGLDQRLAPNAGLSEKVGVLSLAPIQTRRLLESKPLARGGPLSQSDQPLVSATSLNFAALVDAIGPWLRYARPLAAQGLPLAAVEQPAAVEGFPAADAGAATAVAPEAKLPELSPEQIQAGLEVLKCFRGFTAATTYEDKAKVTHFELRFADLQQ